MILTQKQEAFAFNIAVKQMTQRVAWVDAGYSSKYSLAVLDVNASRVAAKTKIRLRIQELVKEHRRADVADFEERQRILTEITRGRLTDYITCGPDKDLIEVGPDSPNTAAFQEITSRTEYDKDGSNAAVITKIKLHDPMQAGRDVAKVKGWLGQDNVVTQDNRVVNFIVLGEKSKELIDKIKEVTKGETDGIE